jgi:hypothetical protein
MRILRSAGAIRLQLDAVELQTLGDLLGELIDDLSSEPKPDDVVHERLYPAAYTDAEAEQSFRKMTHSGLQSERIERAARCLAELAEAPERTSGLARRPRTELTLTDADSDRWMRVLNDLRLVLGTRLAITEEEDSLANLDPADPDALSYVIYGWLTALQDSLVRVLME